MSSPVKLCAVPVRTVMFRTICAYCGKPAKEYEYCDVQLAVLACGDPEHQMWAKRDAEAWLGRHSCVHPEKYMKDPLFKDTDLLSRDVAVPRTRAAECDACGGRSAYPSGGGPKCAKCAGTPDPDGWVITYPNFDESALIRFRKEDGLWTVHVTKVSDKLVKLVGSDQLIKRIPVRDLKMSLPEDKHGLVDAFEARLIAGIYSTAMRAYEEALLRQKEMEEPTAEAAAPRAEDNIVPAFHPTYGYGRVFIPPSAPPSASDPVPPPWPPLKPMGL
jgi:hypothetical protein